MLVNGLYMMMMTMMMMTISDDARSDASATIKRLWQYTSSLACIPIVKWIRSFPYETEQLPVNFKRADNYKS